jgi:hypothetical protein
MQNTDIILVNVVGTNGTTREQRTITRRFNGAGVALDDKGKPNFEEAGLKNLPSGTGAQAPNFPQDEYAKAQATGKADEIQKVLLAHAKQVEQWQKTQGGGSEELALAKAVQDYCVEVHGFVREDAEAFVLKLDDIDVKRDELPDKRSLYTVSGAAVFGA